MDGKIRLGVAAQRAESLAPGSQRLPGEFHPGSDRRGLLSMVTSSFIFNTRMQTRFTKIFDNHSSLLVRFFFNFNLVFDMSEAG